jgi:hypothetical protein
MFRLQACDEWIPLDSDRLAARGTHTADLLADESTCHRRRRADDDEELSTGAIQKQANAQQPQPQPQPREYLTTQLSRDVSQPCSAVCVECAAAAGA